MKASTRGDVNVVELLLEWGADKDAKNNVKSSLISFVMLMGVQFYNGFAASWSSPPLVQTR